MTDFGFAKVLSPGERLYEVCGTPGYLAPELLKAGMVEKEECDGYNTQVRETWDMAHLSFVFDDIVDFLPE